MESSSWLLLALVSALAITFISKIIKIKSKLPPGPKPWPIIGNLNLLGSLPHQSLHHLSQKYGEIMLLKFGKFPVVVASSPKMAEQFLKVHDAAFAARPPLFAGTHLSFENLDITTAPCGPHWRGRRKILMSELLSTKKLENSEQIRVEERRCFLSRLKAFSDKPVLLREHVSHYTLSIMCRLVMTDMYFGESPDDMNSIVEKYDLPQMMHELFVVSGVFNIGDWIPWLACLDLQGYVKRIKALCKKQDIFFGYVIDDHLAKKAAGKDDANKDFVDALLQIADDPNAEVEITRDTIKALLMNSLLGSADTSITAIEWGMHEILRQPRIYERAKQELDTVIGRDRWVEENDLAQLPYINAIVMETFRLHPVAPLLIPHYAIQDSIVAGYNITKGTAVFINAWSIGRDVNSWDEAEEFFPERFLGKQMEMTGDNFALLAFGSGRRMCPGYKLGLKMVRTTLANLLHGFEVKLEEGMRAQDICMDENFGVTTYPKHPLSLVMKPTLPAHLY